MSASMKLHARAILDFSFLFFACNKHWWFPCCNVVFSPFSCVENTFWRKDYTPTKSYISIVDTSRGGVFEFSVVARVLHQGASLVPGSVQWSSRDILFSVDQATVAMLWSMFDTHFFVEWSPYRNARLIPRLANVWPSATRRNHAWSIITSNMYYILRATAGSPMQN